MPGIPACGKWRFVVTDAFLESFRNGVSFCDPLSRERDPLSNAQHARELDEMIAMGCGDTNQGDITFFRFAVLSIPA